MSLTMEDIKHLTDFINDRNNIETGKLIEGDRKKLDKFEYALRYYARHTDDCYGNVMTVSDCDCKARIAMQALGRDY